MRRCWWGVVFFACTTLFSLRAATVDDLKAEVEKLRHDINVKQDKTTINGVDHSLMARYGPNEPATTGSGKLQIQGLIQVWYQTVQNDHLSVAVSPLNFPTKSGQVATVLSETNEGADNDTFRIRRTELRFKLDINENIYSYVMIDPAREASASFLPLPTFARHNSVLGPLVDQNLPSTQLLHNGSIPTNEIQPHLLQDAAVVFHDFIPHHKVRVGQMKPPVGEEALRETGSLDFVERAMVTGINNVRALGMDITGTWMTDSHGNSTIEYAVGAFNGPVGSVLSDPEFTEAGNRSDTQDDKDIIWHVIYHPVWSYDKWYGQLETGYTRTDGRHGKAGSEFDPDFTLNAENLKRTAIWRQGAWASWFPNGPIKGMWMRGEWGAGHDRFGFGANTSLLGLGSIDLGTAGPRGGSAFTQANPTPVTVSGWYYSAGYRMSNSVFADTLSKGSRMQRMLNNCEFDFRYETYQNITTEDLAFPDRHSDQFKTSVYTAGLNYYINANRAKVQANYLWVVDPVDKAHGLRAVRNDVFVLNFQVGF